jgi:hypothetical protein
MVKGGKKSKSKKIGIAMNSKDDSSNADYSVESKVSDNSGSTSPEKLAQMGVIDLRMTRPPRPVGMGNSNKTITFADDDTSGKLKNIQKTQYHELRNSQDLIDEPPPAAKIRRVNVSALKAEKEREVFGEQGESAGGDSKENGGGASKAPKEKVAFANIDAAGVERLRAMLTHFCRKEDGTFFDDINLRAYGIDSGQVVTNGVVQELCVVQPSLTRLDMSHCTEISDVGLWAIARHCRNIKELKLTKCDLITNIGLRSLSLACHNMKRMDFSHCHLLDDIGLTVLSTGAWKLEHIILKDCTGITDTGVGRLAKSCENIQTLDLNGCTNVGEFGDRAIKEIGAFCGSMKYLDLGGCRRVEDGGVKALAVGCPEITTLKLGGCKILTKESLKALSKHSKSMTDILLGGCEKFTDNDFELYLGPSCAFSSTLTSLDLSGCTKISDRGVAIVCKTFGMQLYNLGLSHSNISDFSGQIIVRLCERLRTLDLCACNNVSDSTVHSIARGITGLTTLKLDHCPKVTIKTLISFVGDTAAQPLEFCEMANKWLGFQPKANVAGLIVAREIFRLHTKSALLLQCLVRRKFAYKRYKIRRKWFLMTKVIPRIQARSRGMCQRVKYSKIQEHLFRIRTVIKIQRQWRRFVAWHLRLKMVKINNFEKFKQECAIRVQKRWRGIVSRGIVIDVRNEKLNKKVVKARIIMKEEKASIIVQRTILAFLGRVEATKRIVARNEFRKRLALEERMMRTVQRLSRGRIGRIRAAERRQEIANADNKWESARLLQKTYRALLGRRRFRKFLAEYIEKMRNDAAKLIQKIFRGYRGKIIGVMMKQLKKLRLRKSAAAVRIQCLARGMIARMGVEHYKENILREKRRKAAAIKCQKIFRGHKGREARAIEKELRAFELKAKPLVDLVKRLEEESTSQAKLIARIESSVKRSEEELFIIERELAMCLATTNKFTDSARINNTPQRFLTKYLRVRLKDHYEHEKALHLARYKEMTKRKAACRGYDMEISAARRELLPLTTGVAIHVKKERTRILRQRVRGRQMSATKIQALWRRAVVRVHYQNPHRDYWVECVDLEQSDKPYYYNTWTEETEWKMPLIYKLFGGRGKLEEEEEEEDSDED